MDVIYKYRNDDVDFSEVVRILKNAFGDRGFNLLDVKKSFINSSHVIFAFQNNNLIGFARAISDSSSSIIYNVAIDPTYQSIGVGKDIVNKLVERLDKRLILAFTHPRTISFYEHLGFNRLKNAFKYVKNSESDRIEFQEKAGFFLPNGYKFENELIEDEKELIHSLKVRYSNSLDNINYNELLYLLNSVGYKKNLNSIINDFKNSSKVEFAYINNELIASARLITDNVSEALVLDVAVKDNYDNSVIEGLLNRLLEDTNNLDVFIYTSKKHIDFFNNNNDYRRYKTAFAYKDNVVDYTVEKGFRYVDEFYNPEIKYYKGKIFR